MEQPEGAGHGRAGRLDAVGDRNYSWFRLLLRNARWLLFSVLLVAGGYEAFFASHDDAERNFGTETTSDWQHTNIWLRSAECAQQTGAWLVVCGDDDKLIPISERGIGDDPGHALLLSLWVIASGEAASLVDVARLNITLNTLGFVVLASFLFATRSYICAGLFLYLGPIVYLKWIGVAPHWGLLGVASMAVVLPMAMLAKEYRFLSARLGLAFVGLGLGGLALASLVRESIGLMATVTALGVVLFIVLRRRQAGGWRAGELLVGLLILIASAAPYLVLELRDAVFDVEPGQLVGRHGFSDILYMGLGVVPNSFDISYDDYVALAHAQAVDPDVIHCSPDFFRIMWNLYLEAVLSQPLEVARIYAEKARLILSDPILDPGPPLGVLLLVGLCHFAVATALGLWRRIGFAQGALVEGAALVFIGLFVAQAILAAPGRNYAMPAGAAILMLVGILLGFSLRSAWALARGYSSRRSRARNARPGDGEPAVPDERPSVAWRREG